MKIITFSIVLCLLTLSSFAQKGYLSVNDLMELNSLRVGDFEAQVLIRGFKDCRTDNRFPEFTSYVYKSDTTSFKGYNEVMLTIYKKGVFPTTEFSTANKDYFDQQMKTMIDSGFHFEIEFPGHLKQYGKGNWQIHTSFFKKSGITVYNIYVSKRNWKDPYIVKH